MSIKRKRLLLVSISSVLLSIEVFTQSIPDSLIRRIDNLFSKWNTSASPGCAVGIVRNDSLIFSRGYGMANLEYEIPITAETIFYMASVSKQFTGYCIVLLARQGKLKLDEDIHVYLPWAPDFGKRITVRNLLNHTSGIRDDISLSAISGLGFEGMLTQDLALNIIKRQRSLNFNPGDKYSYSNSNYVLLAEIVKAVSGKSFRSFADSSIFKLLGMSDAHFQDDFTEPIKNRAFSYRRIDSIHYANDFQNVYTLGDGGLFTNIRDMAKWVNNFYHPNAGDFKDIAQLTEIGKLKNGESLTYALGIGVNKYKGWKTYAHSGGLAGYRTIIKVFPDLKMGILVFSNLGDFNPGAKADELADIFIPDTTIHRKQPQVLQRDSMTAILKDASQYLKYAGNYIGEDGLQLNIDIKKDRIHYKINNQGNFLIRDSKDSFSIPDAPQVKFIFSIRAKDTIVDIVTPNQVYHNIKYINETSQTDENLRKYTGTYYSPELDCNYGIELRDHHLFLTSAKYNDSRITLAGNNHLLTDNWWISHMNVIRDSKENIIGFEINAGGIMHLRFNR
jgi:CubicO group peptidase (beta-lactamase class C family)